MSKAMLLWVLRRQPRRLSLLPSLEGPASVGEVLAIRTSDALQVVATATGQAPWVWEGDKWSVLWLSGRVSSPRGSPSWGSSTWI